MVHGRRSGWWLGLLVGIGSLLWPFGSVHSQSAAQPRAELRENYPNPFFPATTIPFALSPRLCGGGRRPTVSLKVYNVLVQVIAIPVLALDAGRTAGLRSGGGPQLDSLQLDCGLHRAYWDGVTLDGAREPTPGIYYYQLTVDGERFTRKMIAQRRVTSRQ